jgi:hypothetical protein
MFIYNYRAFDLYNKPVISLAILGDENQSWRPSSYQYGMGKSEVTIKFDIVKLLDYRWEDLAQSNNVFAIVVMAHLKTKATTSNLTERERWKWQLTRLLYERGYHRQEIANLYKVIDLMMALSENLQLSYEDKLATYQEERKMPLLTNIEQRALVRGQQIGQERAAKETNQQNIIDLLERRFGDLPESLVKNLKQIEDLTRLKQLLIETISVSSVAEFEQLINDNLANQN